MEKIFWVFENGNTIEEITARLAFLKNLDCPPRP